MILIIPGIIENELKRSRQLCGLHVHFTETSRTTPRGREGAYPRYSTPASVTFRFDLRATAALYSGQSGLNAAAPCDVSGCRVLPEFEMPQPIRVLIIRPRAVVSYRGGVSATVAQSSSVIRDSGAYRWTRQGYRQNDQKWTESKDQAARANEQQAARQPGRLATKGDRL